MNTRNNDFAGRVLGRVLAQEQIAQVSGGNTYCIDDEVSPVPPTTDVFLDMALFSGTMFDEKLQK